MTDKDVIERAEVEAIEGIEAQETNSKVTATNTFDSDGNPILFGGEYHDPITGLRGIAVVVEHHLTGTHMVGLTMKGGDHEKPRRGFADAERLTYVDDALTDLARPTEKHDFILGQEVAHKIDPNIKGIIVRFLDQINGCVHLMIQFPKAKPAPDSLAEALIEASTDLGRFSDDHKMFKVIGDGLAAGPEAVKPTQGIGCCYQDFADAERY